MRKFHSMAAVHNTGQQTAVKTQKTAVFNIQRNRKPQSLNSAFRRVFGKALKKKGFTEVNGEHPYLARMAGTEIFHVIACMDEECMEEGYREFSVLGAAATVYRGTVSLEESPRSNDFWLRDLGAFYEKTHRSYDREYHARLVSFAYRKNDAADLDKKLEQALEETEKIMLPVLDAAVSPETCLEYLWRLDSMEPLVPGYDDVRIPFWKFGHCYVELLHEHENRRLDIVAQRDEIYAAPEIYEKAIAELGRRKRTNQEILRSYGLEF